VRLILLKISVDAMLLVIFLLLSIPIGCFCLWFAWKAHQVRRKRVVHGMLLMAFFSFASALLVGGWAYIAITV